MSNKPLCVVFPYHPDYYAYSQDANKWDMKQVQQYFIDKNMRGIAFRCYVHKIDGKKLLDQKTISTEFLSKMKFTTEQQKSFLEHVQSIRKETSTCILQRAIRKYQSVKEEKRYKYCGNVVKEFISTENSYCEQLETIVNLIYKPLLSLEKPLITQDQIKFIFGNITMIYGINKMLLDGLKEHVSIYTRFTEFGKVILQFTQLMKSYSDFCQSYPQINDLIVSMKAPHPFGVFYKEQIETAPEHLRRFDLLSLLITPVQRLPRYRLLLNDLLKHMKPTDVDYENVKKALSEVEYVANFVNEQSKRLEMMQKVADLTSQVKGIPSDVQLLSPGRDYINETQLILKEEYVRILDGEKVVGEYPKNKYFDTLELEISIMKKKPNCTTEFIRKDVQVQAVLFTDLIFFIEKQKMFLVFGDQLHYHSSYEIKDTSLIIRENEVEILHKDDSILLSFDVMNNYDEWKPLLKETFEKQHEINEMKERRKTGQF